MAVRSASSSDPAVEMAGFARRRYLTQRFTIDLQSLAIRHCDRSTIGCEFGIILRNYLDDLLRGRAKSSGCLRFGLVSRVLASKGASALPALARSP
jgi:hypothetical protein